MFLLGGGGMSEKLFGLKFRSSKGFFEDQVIKYI